jgi:ligand-binding sensor domain-containing protein
MLGASAAMADAPSLVLDHLTTEDGLPQATVMTTLQDSGGFVWLGTEDGLVRYDGRELYRYARSRTEPDSLPGNYVWQVVEDADTNLWIALDGAGVAKWDRRTDRFSSYRHDASDARSLSSDRVRTVLVDSRGLVWIGTYDAGIDVLDPTSGNVVHLRHDPNDADALASDRVSALMLDRAGDVWIGTHRGLNRWRAATRTMTRVGPPQGRPSSLHDVEISRILEDRSGALWIGTFENGLFRLDRDGRVLETFRHDARDAASLGSDDVRALLEDRSGRFWVGTAEGGAPRDPVTG